MNVTIKRSMATMAVEINTITVLYLICIEREIQYHLHKLYILYIILFCIVLICLYIYLYVCKLLRNSVSTQYEKSTFLYHNTYYYDYL